MFFRTLLRLLPYAIAAVTGAIFYFLSKKVSPDYYDLVINIAAAFFAIPLLYLFYEIAQSFAHRKLNKEIFDHAKIQIDTEVLSILNQLQKLVFGFDAKGISEEDIGQFLELKLCEIETAFENKRYLGFQVLKNWKVSENAFKDILKNPYILLKLGDEQVISIIEILKSLERVELIQKNKRLYCETQQTADNYKIHGGETDKENTTLPDRYLLLEHLKENEFRVKDFGDISKYNLKKCLIYFVVNEGMTGIYSEVIYSLVSDIKHWLEITGKEILIDEKMFRLAPPWRQKPTPHTSQSPTPK